MYGCRMRNVGSRYVPDASSHQCGNSCCFRSFPTSAPAQVEATQIKLTEKHVEGSSPAQKDMSAVVEKRQGAAFSDRANAKYEAELEAVTRKHGFQEFCRI